MTLKRQLLFAGTFGLVIALGIIAVQNYFRDVEYDEDYLDIHRNFE